jgi:plasmid stabilization system protein ParE
VWYAERNFVAAVSFRAEAERAIVAIAESPTRWPKLTQSERRYIFPRFPFMLVYRVQPNFVEVIAIAHQKRKPDYWTKR